MLTSIEVAQSTARAPFHIPSLDGLRALSFFLVFAAHAGLERVVPGGFGVTVFFFLSGYLITTLMRMEVEEGGRVNLRKFYLRRALRILPPFYVVLLGATALGGLGFFRGDAPLRLMPLASQYLHFSNYWIAQHGLSGIPAGTGVYWSLAVEEHFYLLFPTVFLALNHLGLTGRHKAVFFWGSCALVLAWRCVLVLLMHAPVDRTYMCSDTRVDSIAFGCALAVWKNPILDPIGDLAEVTLWRRILFPSGVVLLLATFVVRAPVFRETLRYTLQGVALTPIFVAAVRWPHWLVFRPLNWKPMRVVGTLTYSLYLVHYVVLSAIKHHSRVGAFEQAVVALLVSLAIAWTIKRTVENPCARLRKRLESPSAGGRSGSFSPVFPCATSERSVS